MQTSNRAREFSAPRTALLSAMSYGTGALSHRSNSIYGVPNQVSSHSVTLQFENQNANLQMILQDLMLVQATSIGSTIEVMAKPLSPVVTPADMLNTVRDAFMLNVSDAAKVFGVTRPTIYLWSTLTDIEQIRAHAVRDRMKMLYRLSLGWNRLGPLTGRWTSQVLRSGQSVIDLLSAVTIDHKAILDAHAQLRSASSSLREAEAVRALNAAKALGPAFDRLSSLQEERERDQHPPEPLP